METAIQWISHYGYLGIFSLLMLGIVGLPVPDETLLTFAGFMIYKQDLHLAPTLIAAWSGSICGITISYGLGRGPGSLVIRKYGSTLHFTQERMDRVQDWFRRVGTWGLLFGFFIPGVRHLTAIAAGTSKLSPLVFCVFAYTGAFLWVSTFISLGYLVGDKWRQTADQIQGHLGTAAWVLAALLAIFLLLRLRSRRGRAR